MAWSLEADLTAMTGRHDVPSSLRLLGLCDDSCVGCQIETEDDWHRAGAETYGLVARVVHSDVEDPGGPPD